MLQQFQTNVKGVNGDADFDQDMLEEIFNAIHKEEIVLPEERTGHVKEVYIWKVLRNFMYPLGVIFSPRTNFHIIRKA